MNHICTGAKLYPRPTRFLVVPRNWFGLTKIRSITNASSKGTGNRWIQKVLQIAPGFCCCLFVYLYTNVYIYIRCPMPFFAGVFREMKGLPNHEPFLKQIGPFRGMGFKDGRAAGSVRSKWIGHVDMVPFICWYVICCSLSESASSNIGISIANSKHLHLSWWFHICLGFSRWIRLRKVVLLTGFFKKVSDPPAFFGEILWAENPFNPASLDASHAGHASIGQGRMIRSGVPVIFME